MKRASRTAGGATAIVTIVGLAILAAFMSTPLGAREQALVGGVLVALAWVLDRRSPSGATLALVALSAAVSLRYAYWRVDTTIAGAEWSANLVGAALLAGAELYAVVMLLLAYLQSFGQLPRRPVPLPADPRDWPSVDVFIPTYNEPLDLVRATVLAARELDWPRDRLRIWLLDDGRRESFRAFAREAGVEYLIRPDNKHAKAGNLNHALGKTSGDLVAIFDCDHAPVRSFLQATVGWLVRDPRLALVQTPHHFYSPDPFERNLGTFKRLPNEGELFYGVIQKGNDLWNATFFCGSCAVLRRRALEENGGIAVETVTEDAHTALRLQRRGWGTAYLDVAQAAGLATESLSGHVGQRIRWARGMAQIFRKDNPLLGRGLKWQQRFCYVASMLHFFSGVPRLIFLVAPLAWVVFDLHVFNARPAVALAYLVPHLALAMLVTARLQGGFRAALWGEVYETCLAWYIARPTLLALVAPSAGSFNVTAKGGLIDEETFDRRTARPTLVLVGLNLVALGAGLARLATGAGSIDIAGMNLVWTCHNLLMLGAVLAVARERQQRRVSPRVSVDLPVMVRLSGGRTLRAKLADLSLGGAKVMAPGLPPIAAGARVHVAVLDGSEEVPLPALVVEGSGTVLRVKFDRLAAEEETALVRTLFGRANAWTHWRDGRRRESLASTFTSLVGLSGQGYGAALKDLVVRRPRAEPLPGVQGGST